jgi:hypothetical protein
MDKTGLSPSRTASGRQFPASHMFAHLHRHLASVKFIIDRQHEN